MEETPKTLIEGFLQSAQTHHTLVPPRLRLPLTRTPDTLSYPGVLTRSASKLKKSDLDTKTPRSMITSYMTTAVTGHLSTRKTQRRRSFPSVPVVNAPVENFTPRTNIAMLMEQVPEETPYIRPMKRLSSRKSLPALPANDTIQLLPMSPSMEEENSRLNSSRRRSRRSSVASKQGNSAGESSTKRRKSSTGVLPPLDTTESIDLLPDSSSGGEDMEPEMFHWRRTPQANHRRSHKFSFQAPMSALPEHRENEDMNTDDQSQEVNPPSSLEEGTPVHLSPPRHPDTPDTQSPIRTPVSQQNNSTAEKSEGSQSSAYRTLSPTSDNGAEADNESNEDEEEIETSLPVKETTGANLSSNAMVKEILGIDRAEANRISKPVIIEFNKSSENGQSQSIFDKSTSLVDGNGYHDDNVSMNASMGTSAGADSHLDNNVSMNASMGAATGVDSHVDDNVSMNASMGAATGVDSHVDDNVSMNASMGAATGVDSHVDDNVSMNASMGAGAVSRLDNDTEAVFGEDGEEGVQQDVGHEDDVLDDNEKRDDEDKINDENDREDGDTDGGILYEEEELEETEEVTEDITENYRLAKTPHLATPRDGQRPALRPLADVLQGKSTALRPLTDVLKDKPAQAEQKQKTTKPGPRKTKVKPKAPLPVSLIKSVFTHYSKMKVSSDVLPELISVTEQFFQQVPADLEAFCRHAGRKTIDENDVELLMKRQRLIKDKNSLNVLIEEHLPLEYRQELIPIARSGNIVYPK